MMLMQSRAMPMTICAACHFIGLRRMHCGRTSGGAAPCETSSGRAEITRYSGVLRLQPPTLLMKDEHVRWAL